MCWGWNSSVERTKWSLLTISVKSSVLSLQTGTRNLASEMGPSPLLDSVSGGILSVSEGMTAERSLDSTDGCREIPSTTWGEATGCSKDPAHLTVWTCFVCCILTQKVLHSYSNTKISSSQNHLFQKLGTGSWERSLPYREIQYKLEVIVWLGEALFYSAKEPIRSWMGRKGSCQGRA